MKDRTVHWDPVLQARQALTLAALPEDQKDHMAFMFRTGNVCTHYYNEQSAEPTQEDFDSWLEGLEPKLATKFRLDGFEASRTALPLRRHAAERKDLGLDHYMKQYLSEQDYKRWEELQPKESRKEG